MERHKCKLCSRTFANGRALGGHMKAHLTALPLPPKPQTLITPSTTSFSYSSSDEDDEEEVEVAPAYGESDDKALSYGLRENPRRSFRFADPEFAFAVDAGSVVQDRESETESKKSTRRRSKRARKSTVGATQKFEVTKVRSNLTESPTEPEPVSSVSDTSPDEDVAMCLMLLSRDRWMRSVVEQDQVERSKGPEEIKLKRKHQSDNTKKTSRSSRALDTRNSTYFPEEAEAKIAGNDKIFECPFCYKVFGSGQALGGHKRSHLLPSSSSTAIRSAKCSIDLNLPAPAEEDELSVVSDA
ncbi:zinc finger protein ZAT1-like [Prosopis cineraria]|uniref:zinc finger protein ZAT1-like n=1 Tax=Prosopis cineraria TaxID=364024 RepID=UPI00240EB438|nr:zinc finger protein ZAT1-like [Prosopis cineraria]